MAGGILVYAAMALAVSGPAPAQTAEPTVEELQKELQQRDKLIQNLVRRVEKLERQVGKGTAAAPAPRVMRAALHPQDTQPAELAQQPDQAAPPPPPPAPPAPATPPPAAAPGPAPGQFEVSEEAAERALERTLVATGNLVVPEGFAEVQPTFTYSRGESPTLVLFNVARNQFTPALGMRLGLPYESQIDISLPWNFIEQQVTDVVVAPAQLTSDLWRNAFGDITVGASKTLFHESGWIPGLLGRVSYEIPNGPIAVDQVPMPSGQSRLTTSLTALKRQDPLVFVMTGGYSKTFTARDINPGDQLSFQTAAFLATSPETTLRGVLAQSFIRDVTVNGVTIPGSNSVQSSLNFGASSILGRGILVDLNVGFGLTRASPSYSVTLSSTYRFGVPGF
jgi:hypothetical protein